jgi:hypothetical protein
MNDLLATGANFTESTVHNPNSYWKVVYQFTTKQWWIEDERQVIGPYLTCEEAQQEGEWMYGDFNSQVLN